jgi:type III pantothenate kinase
MIGAMLLAIDAGNSNLTLGLFRSGALLNTRRAATNPNATTDQLEITLASLLQLDGAGFGDLESMALASVVPVISDQIEAIAERRNIRLVVASAGTVPVATRVERPDETGADRLVNVLAAARLYGTPAIVMDLGTATTIECVAADGAYVGGAIAPGLEIGVEALAARTAKLPRIQLRTPDRVIGRNTVEAMQGGTIFGYQALATGLLERARRELADATGLGAGDIRVVLTGGLSAAPWARGIRGVDVVDPELTLKGLAILHAEVGGGEPLELGLA